MAPLPVGVTATGDDELMDCVPGRLRDRHRDPALVEQDRSNRIPDDEIEGAALAPPRAGIFAG
jgi:hypothetical protein